jgi:hypothetical protein
LLDTPDRKYDPHRSPLKNNWFHHVYAMLPDFVPKSARHVGYYEDNQKTERGSLLAFIATRTDRSTRSLETLWGYLKPHLDELVPKSEWERKKVGETVQALIDMHDAIAKMPNFEAKLAELNAESRSLEEGVVPHIAYGREPPFRTLYEEFTETIKTEIDTAWLASFWARRQHEGNREVVLKILRELHARYP